MSAVIELELGAGPTPGTYVVHVLRSIAGGEPSATISLDIAEVLDSLPQIEAGILASSVAARRVMSVRESAVQSIGVRLFDAVFTGRIGEVYRASSAVATERGLTPQLTLRLTAPGLAALPWEALYDSEAGRYVSRKEPLVRRVSSPYAGRLSPVGAPLRILGIVASPRGLQALDVEAEKERLESALATHLEDGSVELAWLADASWGGLHSALLTGQWHVLHFIGHGGYDDATDEGLIALVGRDGRADFVSASSLADLINEASSAPRLVVLNSCQSGSTGTSDLFAGTAAALVHSGINAVVAMQFAVSDYAALAFARSFYIALAAGRRIDEAVRSGRIGVLGITRDTLEWITPVLYLGGDDTRLLNASASVPTRSAEPAPVAPPSVEADAGAAPSVAAEAGASAPADAHVLGERVAAPPLITSETPTPVVEPVPVGTTVDEPLSATGDPVERTAVDADDAEPSTPEPVATAPLTAEPVATAPLTPEPVATAPLTAEPVATAPLTAEAVATPPVAAEPVAAPPAFGPTPGEEALAASTAFGPISAEPTGPPPAAFEARPAEVGDDAAVSESVEPDPSIVGAPAGERDPSDSGGSDASALSAAEPTAGEAAAATFSAPPSPPAKAAAGMPVGPPSASTGAVAAAPRAPAAADPAVPQPAPWDPSTGEPPVDGREIGGEQPGGDDGHRRRRRLILVLAGAGGAILLVAAGVVAATLVNMGGGPGAPGETAGPQASETSVPVAPASTTVAVPASAAWTPTGVECSPGLVLEVSATGSVVPGDDVSNSPDGWTARFLDSNIIVDVQHAALIGRYGTADPFFVGSDRTLICPDTAGGLELRINDDGLDNNSGAFDVTVTTRPDVDPESLALTTVPVPGTVSWTPTGITCVAGESYQLSATGMVTFEDASDEDVSGPDGVRLAADGAMRPGNVLTTASHRGLIARVAGGDPFAAGSSVTITCPADGALELGPNDAGVGDNIGGFTATITRALPE